MPKEPIDALTRGSRVTYDLDALDESQVDADPRIQFRAWLERAFETESIAEPNAMALSTVDAAGQPSSRIVLLRGNDERGFVFFTNYESSKGHDLATNSRCALLFYWGPLQRQIRIEGRAEILEAHESDGYFVHRPPGHRISAWVSPQSAVIPNRAFLEEKTREVMARRADYEGKRPPFWGGYRVLPERFEFWQGRRDRLHDRICYRRDADRWTIERLAP